jgi:hypothetical protein
MAVLTTIHAAPVAAPAPSAAPSASGPACSIQRSSSLWQLGIEAQELTTAIGQLAEQLETDDPEQRASALAELEAALLAEEGNKAALAAKADATCWVIEHLRGQAAYRQQQAKRLTELWPAVMPAGPMPWRSRWSLSSPSCSPAPPASRSPITSSAAASPPPS